MKIFAGIIALLYIFGMIILPCADAYSKHKNEPKREVIKETLFPLLSFIGFALGGFILFEIIPRIGGKIIENIFR